MKDLAKFTADSHTLLTSIPTRTGDAARLGLRLGQALAYIESLEKKAKAVDGLTLTLQSIHDDAAHALGTDSEPQERLSVARQDLQSIKEAASSSLFNLQA